MCGLVSLGVGIVAELLGLGHWLAIAAALVAGVSGAIILRFETTLGRLTNGQAPGTDRPEQLIQRRRAVDWRSARERLRQQRHTVV